MSRSRSTLCIGAVLGVALSLIPGLGAAEQLTVFAAASTKTALDEIAGQWAQDTGHRVSVSVAGSSQLARQIQQGAPADIFISANAAWMDVLDAENLIRSESRVDLLANSLVLIAHGADAGPVAITPGFDLAGRLGDGRLAMALIDAVPAGIYGKAALQSLGIWDSVAPSVAQADNVRAALSYVSSGEAPFGIVYATDAIAEDAVTVVGQFPPDSHPPIVYPAAIVSASDNSLTAGFMAFLRGPVATDAFLRQGFAVPGR